MRHIVIVAAAALLVAGCTPGDSSSAGFTLPEKSEAIPTTPPLAILKGAIDTSASGGKIAAGKNTLLLVSPLGERFPLLTGDDGAFLHTTQAAGLYDLSIDLPGFKSVFLSRLPLVAGKENDLGVIKLEWLLRDQADVFSSIKGKVQLEGGQFIDARVAIVAPQKDETLVVASVDPSGLFAQLVPPGDYRLRVTHPLHETSFLPDLIRVARNEVVTLPSPIQLKAVYATLIGTVTRETESWSGGLLVRKDVPADGVTVTLKSGGKTTTTDTAGKFQIAGLVGEPNSVFFARPAYHDSVPTSRPVLLTPGVTTPLEPVALKLDRGGLIGKVELADGRDLGDARVFISGTGYSAQVSPDKLAPSSGTFLIAGVPSGVYTVTATKEKYNAANATSVTLAGDGAVVDAGTLKLTVKLGDFVIDDGNSSNTPGFADKRAVTLKFSNLTGASCIRVSETEAEISGGTKRCDPFAGDVSFQLEDRDGNHTVYAQYEDGLGVKSLVLSGSVVLDRVAPSAPSVAIFGGAAFTSRAQILTLTLDVVETGSGIAGVRIAETAAGVLTAPVQSYQRTASFTRSSQADGAQEVDVQFIDGAGNASAVAKASIVVDTRPPAGSIRILRGRSASVDGFTNEPRVIVERTVSAEPNGGYLKIRLANSAGGLGSAVLGDVPSQAAPAGTCTADPCVTTAPWDLDALSNGKKSLYAELQDAAGNTLRLPPAEIVFDDLPPSPATAKLKGGGTTSTSAAVTLVITAVDSGSGLAALPVTLGESLVFGATPVALPSNGEVSYALSPLDGPKQIYVRLQDVAGNAAIAPVAVLLDTTAPSGTVQIDGGARFATSNAVVLTFNASPDTALLAISAAPITSCAAATYATPFTSSLAYNLTAAPTGKKDLYVCFKDSAGNVSAAAARATITFDPDVPVGTLTATGRILAGGSAAATAFTATPAITLTWVSSDATNGAPSEMMLSDTAAFTNASWQPFASTVSWTLPSGDGAKQVFGKLRDPAGQTTTAIASNSLTLDTLPPSPASVGPKGAALVNTIAVTLLVSATDAGGLASKPLTVSEDPFFTGLSPVAIPALGEIGFSLSSSDGAKPVYARYVDGVGNSTVVSTRLTLDQTRPTGDLVLATGSGYTSVGAITATFRNVSPDVTQMATALGTKAALPTLDCTTATYGSYAASFPVNLALPEEIKVVAACLKDAAGNVVGTRIDVPITFDQSGPTGTLTLNGSASPTPTSSRSVILGLSAADLSGVASVAFLDDAVTVDSPEPFASTRSWTLSAGDATKTITARLRDVLGNSRDLTASIKLDTTVPVVTVTLNGGASYMTAAAAPQQLSLAFTESEPAQLATQIQRVPATGGFSFPDCASLTYAAFTAASTLPLAAAPGADGTWAAIACAKDAAGNVGKATTFIIVDQTRPTGSVAINGGVASTTTNATTLGFGVPQSPDVTQLAVVNDVAPACSSATYSQAFAAQLSWNLSASPTGAKRVYVCFKDAAGNTSLAPSLATIFYDPDAPTGSLTLLGQLNRSATALPTAASSDTLVTLNWTASDATTGIPAEMIISDVNTLAGATWQPYSPSVRWVLPSGDGPKTVYGKLRDSSGTVSALVTSNTVVLDTLAPTNMQLTLHDDPAAGAPFTDNGYTNQLTFNADVDAAGAVGFELALEPGFSSSILGYVTEPQSPATSVTFPRLALKGILIRREGVQIVYARFFDAVGNVSATVAKSLTYDETLPVLNRLTPSFSKFKSTAAQFAIDQDGTALLILHVGDVGAPSNTWQPVAINGAYPVTLAPCPTVTQTGCNRKIDVTLSDLAGNQVVAPSINVVLDTQFPVNPTSFTLTAPTGGTVSGVPATQLTTDLNVTIGLPPVVASDPIAYVMISNDPSFTGAIFQSYQTSFPWTLTSGDGVKTVYLKASDDAGNVNPTVMTASITYGAVPAAPAGLSADAGNKNVDLSWGSVGGADTYTVVRQADVGATSCQTLLAGILTGGATNAGFTTLPNSPSTIAADTTVANFTRYCYAVRAVNNVGAFGVPGSPTNIAVAKPVLDAPQWALLPDPTDNTKDLGPDLVGGAAQVKVTWRAVNNATGYRLYWNKDSPGPKFNGTRIASLSKPLGQQLTSSPQVVLDPGALPVQVVKAACAAPNAAGSCFTATLTGLDPASTYFLAATSCEVSTVGGTTDCVAGKESGYSEQLPQTTFAARLMKSFNGIGGPPAAVTAYKPFGAALAPFNNYNVNPCTYSTTNSVGQFLIGNPAFDVGATLGSGKNYVGGCAALNAPTKIHNNPVDASQSNFGAAVGFLAGASLTRHYVIGAPGWNPGLGTRRGRAYLFDGFANSISIDNDRDSDEFGSVIATADLNGDGITDFLVGGSDPFTPSGGRVRAYNGTMAASIVNTAVNAPWPTCTWNGATPNFGNAVDARYGKIMVGAGEATSLTRNEKLFVYSYNSAAIPTCSAVLSVNGIYGDSPSGLGFGSAVKVMSAARGAVGAPGRNQVGATYYGTGLVYTMNLNTGALLERISIGGELDFGRSLDLMDVGSEWVRTANDDDYPDLIVGAPNSSADPSISPKAGRVWVLNYESNFATPPAPVTNVYPLYVIDGTYTNGHLGWVVSQSLDYDDDGRLDFALSAPDAVSSAGDWGEVRIYTGGELGIYPYRWTSNTSPTEAQFAGSGGLPPYRYLLATPPLSPNVASLDAGGFLKLTSGTTLKGASVKVIDAKGRSITSVPLP